VVPRRILDGRDRRAPHRERDPARRRALPRLERLDDPHPVLARERGRRGVQRPEDGAGRGTDDRGLRPMARQRTPSRPAHPGGDDPVLHHALRDLLARPRRVRVDPAADERDRRQRGPGPWRQSVDHPHRDRGALDQSRGVVPPQLPGPRGIPSRLRGCADVQAVRTAPDPPHHDHLRRPGDRPHGAPAAVVAVLVGLKTALDLGLYLVDHARASGSTVRRAID
jgi:hypothetical protein